VAAGVPRKMLTQRRRMPTAALLACSSARTEGAAWCGSCQPARVPGSAGACHQAARAVQAHATKQPALSSLPSEASEAAYAPSQGSTVSFSPQKTARALRERGKEGGRKGGGGWVGQGGGRDRKHPGGRRSGAAYGARRAAAPRGAARPTPASPTHTSPPARARGWRGRGAHRKRRRGGRQGRLGPSSMRAHACRARWPPVVGSAPASPAHQPPNPAHHKLIAHRRYAAGARRAQQHV